MLTVLSLIDRNLSPPWGSRRKSLEKLYIIILSRYNVFEMDKSMFLRMHILGTDILIQVREILEIERETCFIFLMPM